MSCTSVSPSIPPISRHSPYPLISLRTIPANTVCISTSGCSLPVQALSPSSDHPPCAHRVHPHPRTLSPICISYIFKHATLCGGKRDHEPMRICYTCLPPSWGKGKEIPQKDISSPPKPLKSKLKLFPKHINIHTRNHKIAQVPPPHLAKNPSKSIIKIRTLILTHQAFQFPIRHLPSHNLSRSFPSLPFHNLMHGQGAHEML